MYWRFIERELLPPCFSKHALVPHTRVEPPRGSNLRPRDLVESLVWSPGIRDGRLLSTLVWRVEEVLSDTYKIIAVTDLIEQPGAVWPTPALPAGASDPVAFFMKESGEVEYAVGGEFARSGLLNAPESRTESSAATR